MKECSVGGIAGDICRERFPDGCYYQDALRLEGDDPTELSAFRVSVQRNKDNCPRSQEVLQEIDIRI